MLLNEVCYHNKTHFSDLTNGYLMQQKYYCYIILGFIKANPRSSVNITPLIFYLISEGVYNWNSFKKLLKRMEEDELIKIKIHSKSRGVRHDQDNDQKAINCSILNRGIIYLAESKSEWEEQSKSSRPREAYWKAFRHPNHPKGSLSDSLYKTEQERLEKRSSEKKGPKKIGQIGKWFFKHISQKYQE